MEEIRREIIEKEGFKNLNLNFIITYLDYYLEKIRLQLIAEEEKQRKIRMKEEYERKILEEEKQRNIKRKEMEEKERMIKLEIKEKERLEKIEVEEFEKKLRLEEGLYFHLEKYVIK
jgi:hypothetical protein